MKSFGSKELNRWCSLRKDRVKHNIIRTYLHDDSGMSNPSVPDISLSVNRKIRFVQFKNPIFFFLIFWSRLIPNMWILFSKSMKFRIKFHGNRDEIFSDHSISNFLKPDIKLFLKGRCFNFDWRFKIFIFLFFWLLHSLCY